MLAYLYAKLLKKLRGSALRSSLVHKSSKVESGSTLVNSKIERHAFCGYDCVIINAIVGPFTSIGTRVTIGGASHPMQFVSMSPAFLSHKDSIKTKFARHIYLPELLTRIGADVWIGDGAFIKSGISIGPGAVVGMGAVVTRDVPAYAIVAGNPARIVRYRFSGDICERLLRSKWWDLNDSKLLTLGPLINNSAAFLESVEADLIS